ncbi:MAG: flap endonuclease [Defluviitaleaceae bacterium]|nr:flap endonuclease [Defluviitaleaceae bacterium]
MKLLIIDGHNLLFQMFFGMPTRIVGKKGQAIQGTLGFVGATIKMIKKVEPTHIVVLFDGEHDNLRTELSADYKANRIDYSDIPDADNPFSQLEDIYAALDCMGILHTEIVCAEADDVIAAYALTYGDKMEIVISSFDSDFFQLISDNVTVLRYRGDKTVLCDISFVQEKFGIPPSLYADFKALTGDTADNIKGADKIGPKTAAILLHQLGSLQGVIKNADLIKRQVIRESVIQSAERLKINYLLIKLASTVEMPFDLDQLRYNYKGITTNMVLEKIGLK